MLIFNYVLILLAALILANLINHFLPALSVPIVQIILGASVSLILYGVLNIEIELEPELFFVLFLSPLVFHSTMTANKKEMRDTLKPILRASVYLLLLTILIGGCLSHILIPSIPLAAAFALAAALGPTDVVAVEAVERRVSMPRRVVSILSGESIFNDATGIVCFQFAVIAVVTGSFNLLNGVTRFLILAFGGILVGLVMSFFKYMLMRWIRSLHIETAAIHVSIGLITPFIIYMVAEKSGVSGILAVFACGMVHSLYRDKLNPEMAAVNNAQESMWSVLSFNLDGLVFVILGTQLHHILKPHNFSKYSIGGWQIAGYVLIITFAFIAIRFIWWVLTVSRKVYDDDPKNPVGRIKSGIIFGTAGARGAVPMASVLSIPLLLPNGAAFPQRDLIILIAGGVIITSLLITNFTLPFLAEQKSADSTFDTERTARAEILQTVVEQLKSDVTPKILAATEIVMRNYYSRMNHNHGGRQSARKLQKHHELRRDILLWEKDVVLRMTEMEQISRAAAEKYIKDIDKLMSEKGKKTHPLRIFTWSVRHFIQSLTWREHTDLRGNNFVGLSSSIHKESVKTEGENLVKSTLNVAAKAFHCERMLIQQMLDGERISWKTAKEMQANISMIEAQLQME